MSQTSAIAASQAVPTTNVASISEPASLRSQIYGGLVYQLSLLFVWLTIASGAFVFAEPAPSDLLMAGLIALLPLVGLASVRPTLLLYFCLWLIIAAAGFWASTQGSVLGKPTIHTIITLFLSIGMLVLANFIAQRPKQHTNLILNAQLVAATLAAIAGVIGYFNLLPGGYDLFTKFGRATGPFKDPNVFGPFVGFAALYALHLVITCKPRQAMLPLAMLAFLTLGLLLSFSRGAWLSFAISVLIYGYLSFVTAQTSVQRIKLVLLSLLAVLFVAIALIAISQTEQVANLLSERATLSQGYDNGPEGRFAGHAKARQLLLSYPLGIGASEFHRSYHAEDVHNVYLVMFLNTGWLGGIAYLFAILVPAALGLRFAFTRGPLQPVFLVVYAVYIGTLAEGLIIDTDHWRHFYLLLALVMGLWAAYRPGPELGPLDQAARSVSSEGMIRQTNHQHMRTDQLKMEHPIQQDISQLSSQGLQGDADIIFAKPASNPSRSFWIVGKWRLA